MFGIKMIIHSKLRSITHVAIKVILQSFVVLIWMRDTIEFSVACNTMEFEFIVLSSPLVWSIPLGLPRLCGISMHEQFNKWHTKKKKIKNKKVILQMTHGTMQDCGLTVVVVCINDKNCDIRERNMTIRIEI